MKVVNAPAKTEAKLARAKLVPVQEVFVNVILDRSGSMMGTSPLDEADPRRSAMSSIESRRIAIGDVHGELDGLREILLHAGLINDRDSWTGGGSLLIQVGDVIDRGPHSRECVGLLRSLQSQALGAGGQVVRLCGNHELMLLQGHYRYANFSDPASLAREIGDEVAAKSIVASFSDGLRLYTHAGLRSAIRIAVQDQGGVNTATSCSTRGGLKKLSDRLNSIFISSLKAEDLESHPIFHVDRVRGGPNDIGGIFWGDYTLIVASEHAYDIPQIFGHTPTRKRSVNHCRGLKLIDIDTGMCQVYGGNRVYLESGPGAEITQHSKGRTGWKQKVLT
jgi:calcineurin-like phosphoesterase family protein